MTKSLRKILQTIYKEIHDGICRDHVVDIDVDDFLEEYYESWESEADEVGLDDVGNDIDDAIAAVIGFGKAVAPHIPSDEDDVNCQDVLDHIAEALPSADDADTSRAAAVCDLLQRVYEGWADSAEEIGLSHVTDNIDYMIWRLVDLRNRLKDKLPGIAFRD